MQLVPKPIGGPAKLLQQGFLRPTQFAQHQKLWGAYVHQTEAVQIGPQGIGQHERIAPVILGTSHRVAVPKARELFGLDGKYCAALLEQRFHDGTAWRFNGDAHLMWLPVRDVVQPACQLCQARSIMGDYALSHTAALPIEDIDLMSLVAPIDPHKPVVRGVAFLR